MNTKHTILALAVSAALTAAPTARADRAGTATLAQTQAAAATAGSRQGGSLRGRVLDESRGVYLAGALVSIVGTSSEARTNREGRFVIAGVAPGEYDVEIDYLGYEAQRHTVRLAAGEQTLVDLRVGGERVLDEVVVRGIRDTQLRSLNRQRAADNIVSVVSADSIGRFADKNVAEALARVPGVAVARDQGEGRYISVRGTPTEFNAVALDGVILPAPDGDTRAVDLDTIPTDIVSSLEITKALTPNMDADSIGGHIDVQTQSAFDSDGPILRTSAGYGRNQLGGGGNQRYAVTWGNAFDGERVGLLLSANYYETNRETDNFENDFAEIDGQVFPTDVSLKDYELVRKRQGVNGRVDFQMGGRGRLYVSALHSKFEDREFRHNTILEYGGYAPGSTPALGTATDVTLIRELRNRHVENTIDSFALGMDYELDRLQWDFRVAHTRGKRDYPTRAYLAYELAFEPDIAYDFRSPNDPVWTPAGGQPNQVFFDPSEYEFSYYQTRHGSSRDNDLSVDSSVSIPFVARNIAGDVQVGVKVRSKEKWNDEDRRETEENVAGLELAQAMRAARSDNFGIHLGNRYRRDLFSTYGSIYATSPDFISIPRRAYTADYDAEENIYAAYGMTTFSWNASRMVVGGRFERTEVDSEAWRFDRETDLAVRQSNSSRYSNFFPSLHFRHELGDGPVLRAAYSTALNRPNIVDVVPSIEERDRGPGRREVTRGNPDLDPTYAHNFDVMFDYYLRPYGVVSAGVFYKRLSHVIFDVAGERPFEGELWEVTEPENGASGRAYGVELNWQQPFAFLPQPFDGLGVMINYTYTHSRADLPFGLGEVRLPGQSDNAYNVGVFYEHAGFSGMLAYNKRSKFVDSVSLTSRELDVYWDAREQLDFTASYEVSNRFQVYGEAANLTDKRQNRFRGTSSRVYESEGFGRFYQVGLRMSL